MYYCWWFTTNNNILNTSIIHFDSVCQLLFIINLFTYNITDFRIKCTLLLVLLIIMYLFYFFIWSYYKTIKGEKEVFVKLVSPAMIYRFECWAWKKMEIAEMRMWRCIYGVTMLNTIRNEYIEGSLGVT